LSPQSNVLAIDAIESALPTIPARIRSRHGYWIDTTGPIWAMPFQVSGGAIKWDEIKATPAMKRVLMGYIATKIQVHAESTVSVAFHRLSSVKAWDLLTDPWWESGEVLLKDTLAVKRHLEERYGLVSKEYFLEIKRLYRWASGIGVPGFSPEVWDELDRVRDRSIPSFSARLQVAPGAPRSQVTKNRHSYSEIELMTIAAHLLRTEKRWRAGETLYRPVPPPDGPLQRLGHTRIKMIQGVPMMSTDIGLIHFVIAWLAWNFGDRPLAFAKLRESHFESIEAGGVLINQVRMPETKDGQGGLGALQGPVPMEDTLARLVEELIAENRAERKILGMDNGVDWPLLPAATTGPMAVRRSRQLLPHDDLGLNAQITPRFLIYQLRQLFEVMQVPNAEGNTIIPTFYSFRDGLTTTRLARGMPPMVVAIMGGRKTTRSLHHYNKPGVTMVERMDRLVPQYGLLARTFQPADPIQPSEIPAEAAIPYIDLEESLFIGLVGRCGCVGSGCPMSMNGAVECYVCPAFRAVTDGPHLKVLDTLERRRRGMIQEGLPAKEYERYDQHIVAASEVVKRIQALGEAGK